MQNLFFNMEQVVINISVFVLLFLISKILEKIKQFEQLNLINITIYHHHYFVQPINQQNLTEDMDNSNQNNFNNLPQIIRNDYDTQPIQYGLIDNYNQNNFNNYNQTNNLTNGNLKLPTILKNKLPLKKRILYDTSNQSFN